ncbi:hypothetical protein KXS11_10795 [Plantibacter flavus]|uniref:hypothetical protein n=1 Tax=Plantibacter flavus TaxID=150123 RepID=UPI003F18DB0B
MTTLLERETQIVWAELDASLWVASTGGEYAGMVEFRDGRFLAASETGQPLGEHVSLLRAKAAVESGPKAMALPVLYVAGVAATALISASAVAITALAVF